MAESVRGGGSSSSERDIDQAITALKKGGCLLKYGRRGKPKFCPFRLSNDETLLIWYSDKQEKHLKLCHVSKITPGQRTPVFQRYPRPEKEYQSFSLLYGERSLDVICKDKEEAEIWFVGLNALIARNNHRLKNDRGSVDSCTTRARRNSPSIRPFDPGDAEEVNVENAAHTRLGKAISDIATYTAVTKQFNIVDTVSNLSVPPSTLENSNGRNSATTEGFRVSLSSAISLSSQGSFHGDFDALGDVFIWGEGIGGGLLGGGAQRVGSLLDTKMNALLPKELESTIVLDSHGIACGSRHASVVTRQGEVFSWGEEIGGRLGHGTEVDVSQPKRIDVLSGIAIELVACGEYHTCAVTISGELYSWGDGGRSFGLLGHGSEISHWIPRKVSGPIEGIHISYVSCGLWHTAAITSAGQLFTFGDGSFGVLGHGDRSSTSIPKEVEYLRGLRTTRVSCGIWHTAAVVDVINEFSPKTSGNSSSGQLYTWGDGEKGQLGHDDNKPRLAPECVAAFEDIKIFDVACGHSLTIALTASGQVYTMGSTAFGQLGEPSADGKVPIQVRGKIADSYIEEIACGSYHVAVLTSKSEVYTWGKGSHGQLGHGDTDNRDTPTLVDHLKDKHVKSVVCGTNLTAVICLHKWASGADHSVCFGCRHPFGFRRKRHNCYNCGLVFCKACSSKRSINAALAPNMNKPYRVCDDCYTKLRQATETVSVLRKPKSLNENALQRGNEPKQQASLTRFSSFSSGNCIHSESWNCSSENHAEMQNSCVFPGLLGASLLRDFNLLKASNSNALVGVPKKAGSVSVPVSRAVSRNTSPISTTSSPQWSPEELNLQHVNESLNQEIMSLRTQVEDLTSKSQNLEAELEKTTKKWKEMTEIVAEETEKSKSSKDVIKSLTSQLKDLARKLPDGEGQTVSYSTGSVIEHSANFLRNQSQPVHYITPTRRATPLREPNSTSANQTLANGPEPQTTDEVVVQDEPGVYLTLSPLPNGGNELKRVRFSRRHYTEGQAEKWWVENRTKVCERHNARSSE